MNNDTCFECPYFGTNICRNCQDSSNQNPNIGTTYDIQDLQQDYIHDAVAGMNMNNIWLVDKTHGCKGAHINVSHFCPSLALIFKTMLLCAMDKRAQKITVQFDDCTAVTEIEYPEPKK